MRNLQEIIAEARLLPPEDRRRLIDALEELPEVASADLPADPYVHSLAMAATVDSGFSDVSTDKYPHLAEAYAASEERR